MPYRRSTRTPGRSRAGSTSYASRSRGPEDDLLQAIRDVCARLGYPCFHDPDARRCAVCGTLHNDRRVRGFPDLVILRPPGIGRRGPYVLFVELKSEVGRLSEEQKTWGRWLTAAAKLCPGVYYAIWKPRDLDNAIALLSDGYPQVKP